MDQIFVFFPDDEKVRTTIDDRSDYYRIPFESHRPHETLINDDIYPAYTGCPIMVLRMAVGMPL